LIAIVDCCFIIYIGMGMSSQIWSFLYCTLVFRVDFKADYSEDTIIKPALLSMLCCYILVPFPSSTPPTYNMILKYRVKLVFDDKARNEY
jgi:hypothetical protein